jgi:hypothetical protein
MEEKQAFGAQTEPRNIWRGQSRPVVRQQVKTESSGTGTNFDLISGGKKIKG